MASAADEVIEPVEPTASRWWQEPPMILAAAALVIGIVLRCWHAGSEPFWIDEGYSAYFADQGPWFLWHVLPRFETHPPTYYTMLWGWDAVFGRSVLTRRALGLLFGFGTIALIGAIANVLGRLAAVDPRQRRWLCACAITLAAVHPLMIEMSRQVRAYPVMDCVYAGTILALLRLAEDAVAARRLSPRWLFMFFAGETAMLWLHDLGPLFALPLSLSLLLLITGRGVTRRDWVITGVAQAVVGVAYLPALAMTLRQASTWAADTWLDFDPVAALQDLGGLYITWTIWACVPAGLLVIVGLVQLVRPPSGARLVGALLLLALLPPTISYLVSWLKTPIFITRTLSPAAVPAIVAMATAVLANVRWRWPVIAFGAAIALITARTSIELRAAGPQQDWYGIVAWLDRHMAPGDVLWAYPNETDLPLSYALADRHDPHRSVPIPGPIPVLNMRGWIAGGVRGVLSLYPDQMAQLVRSPAAQAPGTIWLVECSSDIYDPDNDMKAALGHDRTLVADHWWGPIEVMGYRKKALSAGPAAPEGAAAAHSA